MTRDDMLLRSLEIPEYTNRQLAAYRVKKKSEGSIISDDGWISKASPEVLSLLDVGDSYIVETQYNTVSGYIINGKWYDRESDQELSRKYEAYVKESREKYEAYVEEHRQEWLDREASLPDWLKAEMEEVRNGPEFGEGLITWGYVLIICELAVMYSKMGEAILDKDYGSIEDTEEISKFAREEGTSGNQHQIAMALAKRHIREGK